MGVPRCLLFRLSDVLLPFSVFEVPQNDDRVGDEHHRQGVDDGFLSPTSLRIGAGDLLWPRTVSWSTPPAVLGIFHPEVLLEIPEADLDFPAFGELAHNLGNRPSVLK